MCAILWKQEAEREEEEGEKSWKWGSKGNIGYGILVKLDTVRWAKLRIFGTVVAGSPHEPMTRSISCDLERRGFVVFVTVSSAEEDHMVQSENRTDIRPLWIDLTTVCVYDGYERNNSG